ncbi:MAG: hypothetical protein UH850_14805 [Paludibacteraceae bacterium]|nr:hypothetical protein [Paludibacteraceae bacterium]
MRRKSYKTMTDYEFNVLNKVLDRTGNDCWAFLKQDCHGVDYVWDMEERKRYCLKTGVGMIADAIDCQENFDNCRLEWTERVTLRNLFEKLGIDLGPLVDWRLPEFIGMSLDDFKKLRKEYKGEKYQKHGDDYYVDGEIYQFDRYDKCFSIVHCN